MRTFSDTQPHENQPQAPIRPIDPARITVEPDLLRIEAFVTDDRDVIAAFSVEDPARYPAVLESILEVGAAARLRAGARADLDHLGDKLDQLEGAFGDKTREFQERLAREVDQSIVALTGKVDELFGDGGPLQGLLDPEAPGGIVAALAEQVSTAAKAERDALARLFDPRSPTSPLSLVDQQLRELKDGFHQVRTELAAERAGAAAAQAEAAKGTRKGKTFEEDLLVALREVGRPFGDIIEFSGDQRELSGRKVGDYVAVLSEADVGARTIRIALEGKAAKCGLTEMRRQLAAARDKRGAVAAIGIYASESYMPTGSAPLCEISPVDFAVLYEPDQDDKEALALVYRFVRILALAASRHSESGTVDHTAFLTDIKEARSELASILNLRGELTRLGNGVANAIADVKQALASRAAKLAAVLERMEERMKATETAENVSPTGRIFGDSAA